MTRRSRSEGPAPVVPPPTVDSRGPGDDAGRAGRGSTDGSADADLAHRVALASLPLAGPARLAALVALGPEAAWALVRDGDAARHPALVPVLGRQPVELVSRWRRTARQLEPGAELARHRAWGVEVVAGDDPRLERLAGDPQPPSVLFVQGALAALARPTVAVVGTRDCTAGGLETAHLLGRQLAAAGVAVVSGLALGIDGAAHAGALAAAECAAPDRSGGDDGNGARGEPPPGPVAAPVAVVGCGLDVTYPPDHRALWHAVRHAGLLVSEHPLGTRPAAWRFPLRNRLIAGLSDVVVVVESHVRGGALHTVDEALARDVDVLAVPGPVRSPACAGTNRLLRDGAGVACDVDDVLARLGLAHPHPSAGDRPAGGGVAGDDPVRAAVLDALGWEACSLDQVALRTGLDLATVAAALAALEDERLVVTTAGWYERTTPR